MNALSLLEGMTLALVVGVVVAFLLALVLGVFTDAADECEQDEWRGLP